MPLEYLPYRGRRITTEEAERREARLAECKAGRTQGRDRDRGTTSDRARRGNHLRAGLRETTFWRMAAAVVQYAAEKELCVAAELAAFANGWNNVSASHR